MYDGDDGDDGDGRRDPTLKARPPRAPSGANNDDDFDKPLGIFLFASRLWLWGDYDNNEDEDDDYDNNDNNDNEDDD